MTRTALPPMRTVSSRPPGRSGSARSSLGAPFRGPARSSAGASRRSPRRTPARCRQSRPPPTRSPDPRAPRVAGRTCAHGTPSRCARTRAYRDRRRRCRRRKACAQRDTLMRARAMASRLWTGTKANVLPAVMHKRVWFSKPISRGSRPSASAMRSRDGGAVAPSRAAWGIEFGERRLPVAQAHADAHGADRLLEHDDGVAARR